MCNPVRDHGPARWHRDFYPPLNCPLMAYVDDILENGPRYVQWNVPLYDDSVLWVVPGSHVRRNTPEENTSMSKNPRTPVPGGVQTHLRAGDGVIYILPILHWGSNYTAKLRRTMHGGFARLTHWRSTHWIEHLSPAVRDTCLRWNERATGYRLHGLWRGGAARGPGRRRRRVSRRTGRPPSRKGRERRHQVDHLPE